jgi:hypothetical protein
MGAIMRYGSVGTLIASSILSVVALSAAAAAAEKPVITHIRVGQHPPIPAGLKVACMPSPTILTSSKTCPVVKFHGITTWAYSFIDNRVSMALVSYDANNNVVGNITKDGARYVWNITPGAPQSLDFFGQSNQHVSATWAELSPPQVVAVPANSNPPVPAGLKVTCMANGTSLNGNPTCPVIKYQGITTWAYSFIDNRVAMAFVSYDANNKVVRNVTLNGARYVWQIVSDPANQTVTASGQSNQTVMTPWSQVGP